MVILILHWSFCGGQTAWGLDWINFLANQYVSPALYLSKCKQTSCSKEAKLCTKAGSLCLFIRDSMLSLIPWLNSQRNSQEGRENWEDSEFDQFKSCTQGPDFSCQALAEGLKENSTLMELLLRDNNIGPEGAKAWCLVRMVRKRWQKGIARSKIQAIESEVSEMLKGSEKKTECSFTMFSMLPAKRDQARYQQQVGGLQKGDTVYIGPQRWNQV